MKKLLLALLIVAFAAMPAFASVQNVKIGGSIDSSYLFRQNFDLNNGAEDDEQSVAFTQTLVDISADLTENVSAVIELINERPWDADSGAAGSDIDLNLAYVTLREMLYSPLTVVIGRQSFRYGNSFIFDTAGTNNVTSTSSGLDNVAEDLAKSTGLDAVRVILDYNPLKIEAFIAVVEPGVVTAIDDEDSKLVYGIDATYELGDKMNTLLEGYMFLQKDKTETTGQANDVDTLRVIGGRAATTLLDAVNVSAEIAHQGGKAVNQPATGGTGYNTQERDSWGFQYIANYAIPVAEKYKPVLQYEFTKVYGDDDTDTTSSADNANDKYTAWSPFFENQAGGKIYNALFNLTNSVTHTISLQASPMEDLMAKVSFTKLWLADKYPASTLSLLQPDGGTFSNTKIDAGNRTLGDELDLMVLYDYTEDVQFGLNCGIFKPGSVFRDDLAAKQVIANVNVKF